LGTEREHLRFANLTFRGLHRDDILRDDGDMKLIVTVNAEIIVQANHDQEFAGIINRNWATLDGQWPYLLARWRSRRKDIEKISGSDFVYELCATAAQRDLRVFLLGADAEVNRLACAGLRREFEIEVAGYAPPVMALPFPDKEDGRIIDRIAEFRPHILVVAFGAPKQELWADAHLEQLKRLGICWVIGAGGTLDFIAGTLRRAPVFMQRAGLESLWRLALQPKMRFRRLLRAFQFIQYAK
jgi:N-acetylglucosaminyldiphosphoundecaprenol N-acetyl-beta-D-mannosaminyltransferase